MAVQKQDGLHTDVGPSGADLTGKEFFFAKRNADGTIVLAGSGDYVEGVISQGRPIGKRTSFNTTGNTILKVTAGSALNRGDLVSSDAQGRAVVGTTNIFGRVRNPVTAAGQMVEINPARRATA